MRVAFTLIGTKDWLGGSQYLKNLLSTLDHVCSGTVEPILFVGYDAAPGEIDALRPYVAKVVRHGCFTMFRPSWIMRQALRRLFDRDVMAQRVFKRQAINVVFHSGLFGSRFDLPCVNWIPDFQHLYMPEMFSEGESRQRDRLFRALAMTGTRLMLSSESAKRDFESFMPERLDRVDVLRFASLLPEGVYSGRPWERLQGRGLPEKFFYLPAQFWKHKNHLLVVEALKLLKGKHKDIFVVCTGKEKDYRNPGYVEGLKAKISECGVERSIALLGLVPREDLYLLMRQSTALLNPSFFEGWSTTVEEAKSLGKKVLLSDIAVHREQAPPGAVYYDPKDPAGLAEKMTLVWEGTRPGPDRAMEAAAKARMDERVAAFARGFADIIWRALEKETIGGASR